MASAQICPQDVDARTRKDIVDVIESTWDPRLVGKGRDAENLNYFDFKVTDVKRLNNRRLVQSYEDCKAKINGRRYLFGVIENIPPKLRGLYPNQRNLRMNELYLFHGTEEDAAKRIIREGFDPSRSDPRAMFGQGIYFTEKFTKADQYTDDSDERDSNGTELTLLLCKVIMGKAFECRKQDAQKFHSPPSGYDSVLGTGGGMLFREFVVYDGSQCYPEFIIKYKRIGKRGRGDETREKQLKKHEKIYLEMKRSKL